MHRSMRARILLHSLVPSPSLYVSLPLYQYGIDNPMCWHHGIVIISHYHPCILQATSNMSLQGTYIRLQEEMRHFSPVQDFFSCIVMPYIFRPYLLNLIEILFS
jgi:hypothetical protein